jgi:hypothetical protein
MDGSGTASFYFKGASYGPNGEEIEPWPCTPLYELRTSSVDVDSSAATWLVHSTKNVKVSCAIQENNYGAMIVGGEVAISIESPKGGHMGDVILADNTEESWITNVEPTSLVYIEAAPWGGYRFLHWTIRRQDGSGYRDYNAILYRSGDTSDAEYFAEFQRLD